MIFNYLTPSVLIVIAGALFTLGYLVINQVVLRLILMLGSFCYLAYYWTVADEPLWGAIYGSILMITANFIGLGALFWRNAQFSVPTDHADIYALFAPARPGDFRSLMQLGVRSTITKETILTHEGQPLDKVFFIISGEAQIIKGQEAFPMPGPVFTGEVAYLLKLNSVATTIVPAGSEIITWHIKDLNRAIKRHPRIKLAFDAVISQDLATKVWHAVAPKSQTILPQIKRADPQTSPLETSVM